MALQKTIIRSDLSEGNYIRLVGVQLPTISKDRGIENNGLILFNVYKSEEAAKQLGADIFATKVINVPASFFQDWTLPDTFDSVAAAVYSKKAEIPGLEDAEDLLEETQIEE